MRTWTFFVILPLIGKAQMDLVKTTLLSGRVQLLVPKQLTPITDAKFKTKYGQMARPVVVLTDEYAEVNLIADTTRQPLEESKMEQYTNNRIANLQKKRPDLNILAKGVKIIHGKNVGYCKFLVKAADQTVVYNYYFFVIAQGKVVFFSFNWEDRLNNIWGKNADRIVESLKVN